MIPAAFTSRFFYLLNFIIIKIDKDAGNKKVDPLMKKSYF